MPVNDDSVIAPMPDAERRSSRRRMIFAGAAGAAAAVVAAAPKPAAAASGNGDQDVLVLGSNDNFRSSPGVNVANVSSVATVVQASPDFGNFILEAGNFVFRADASPAATATGIHGLEGIGAGFGGAGVSALGPPDGYGTIAFGGTAVYASSNDPAGVGVDAYAVEGAAVRAHSTIGYGAHLDGGKAAVRLLPQLAAGAPADGAHLLGEILVDSKGDLYLCVASGTPGTWTRLNQQAVTNPVEPGPVFTPLKTPERFIDTRIGLGGVQGPVVGGTTSVFQMTGRNGAAGNPGLQIPASATTLIGNLTVVGGPEATVGAYVTLWPDGPRPTTSSINFGPGAVVANALTVALAAGEGGQKVLTAFAQQPCDYIVDVIAYFA